MARTIDPMLIVALVQNAGLLLAMVVVFDLATERSRMPLSRASRVVVGVAIGLIGALMIAGSVRVGTHLIFDTRSVLLSVCGVFLGPLPTAIAMFVSAGARVLVGGGGVYVGIGTILSSGAVGMAWGYFRRGPLSRVSTSELYVMGLLVHGVMIAVLVGGLPAPLARRVAQELAVPIMLVHPLATVALGLLFVRKLRYYLGALELSRSEERFRLLAENALDVICRFELAPALRFTYVSPSATALTGHTPEEFYETPELCRELVHPQDRPILKAIVRGELPSGPPPVLRLVRGDETRWIELRIAAVRDGEGRVTALEVIVRDITERKQADELARIALSAAKQGFFDVDVRSGRVTVSDEYARMIGYDPATFVETTQATVERAHSEDRERLAALMRDYLAKGEGEYRAEFRQRTRDGDWIWVLSVGSVVSWDGEGRPVRITGTRTDITPLKVADQRAREAQAETARLLAEAEKSRRALLSVVEDQQATERELLAAKLLAQSTLDALKEHICVLDENGTIIAVNDEWCAFAAANGARPQSVLAGANYLDVCDRAIGAEAEAAAIADAIRAMLADRLDTFSMEYACHAPNAERWFVVRITRFVTDGRSRLVVSHENITERKLAENELVRLHQAQKLESLGSLAGGVAHDINNVLAAILGLATAHRRHLGDDDPLAKALDTITNACKRGRSVVRSLLYFARNEMESRGTVDLNAVALEVVQLLDKTTLKRVALSVDLDDTLPVMEGDENAISRAIMNLCVNSIDAMPEGGNIVIRTRHLADGRIEVSVRDTGVGMTEEVRAKAIEPFFTTKPTGKGTGLGLAMVYGTVKSHDGSLEILSAPGEGTEIQLRFPPPATVLTKSESRAGAAPASAQEGRPLTVLLVDDDELIRDAVETLLSMEGHEVVCVDGGAAALRILEEGLDPDVVILDMNMPGMTGAQTLPRILELRPGQRVLVCSGNADDEMAALSANHPNVLGIPKPFSLEELDVKLAALALR